MRKEIDDIGLKLKQVDNGYLPEGMRQQLTDRRGELMNASATNRLAMEEIQGVGAVSGRSAEKLKKRALQFTERRDKYAKGSSTWLNYDRWAREAQEELDRMGLK